MLLLALAFFFPAGDTQNVLPGKISFYGIQISTFFNHTVVENRGSGWLGDMEISSWDSEKETIIFRKPWSKGNFSNDEILEVEEIFQVYFFGFVREAQKHMSDFQVEYPFEIQVISGCEVNSQRSFDYFMRVAVKGLDLLSIKNHSCWPAPEGGSRAQKFCTLILQYKGICDTVEILLTKTCPRYLMSVIEAGKSDLQKQVKPDAWLSQGPSPGPGLLQLVCHVSGFYPKPVWVMWMRGEQELSETQRGDILPNADDTWYLQATLDVVTEEATGLSCRVKHSSLGGQDIVLYWGHSNPIGWIILAIVSCLIFFLCFALWCFRRLPYEGIF